MTKLTKTGNSSPQYFSVLWDHDVDWALDLGFCGDGETSVSVAVRSLLRWRRTECCVIIVANKSTPDNNNNNAQQHQLHTQQQDFLYTPPPVRVLERPTTSPGGAATGNRGERRRRRRRATICRKSQEDLFSHSVSLLHVPKQSLVFSDFHLGEFL